MKFAALYLALLFTCRSAPAQVATGDTGQRSPYDAHYYGFISRARSLRSTGDYRASGRTYDSAFRAVGWRGRPADLYDAACSWSLAGAVDQAFVDLYRAVRQGKFADPEAAEKDKDLAAMTSDKRWPDVLEYMTANKMADSGKFDLALQDTLNRIYTLDQASRQAIDSVGKRYGQNSRQMDSLYEAMSRQDSTDQVRIEEILGRRGWPSPDEVGRRASMAVFLVIQHGDSMMHARYLPTMEEAVQRGAARAEDLALLEDRLLTEQGKPQLYGSQVRVDSTGKAAFFPISDEIHVDERRAAVGLEPLESYAHYFGIDYPLPLAVKPPSN